MYLYFTVLCTYFYCNYKDAGNGRIIIVDVADSNSISLFMHISIVIINILAMVGFCNCISLYFYCNYKDAGNGRIKEEDQFSIEKKLQYVRNQLSELNISVCKFTTCELSSLLLEIRLGEIKVSLYI